MMGRQGETFVGLYSDKPLSWTDNPGLLFVSLFIVYLFVCSDYLDRELVAHGSENVWVCHVGDSNSYSNFSHFTQAIHQIRKDEKLMKISIPSLDLEIMKFFTPQFLTFLL